MKERRARKVRDLLDVGVLVDDEGRLATQLEGEVLDGRRGGLRNLGASGDGASEGDLADQGVGDEWSASIWAIARDDVQHARREAEGA